MDVAVTTTHFRFHWGPFDYEVLRSETPAYNNPTDYATLGESAAVGAGIGVRRATVVLDRAAVSPADDTVQMHFDFLNITDGDPDDTWITSDYETLETLLNSWWVSTKAQAPTWDRLARITWHRVGPGVTQPNPATRIVDVVPPVPGTGATDHCPQQACSITFMTALRGHWGRTYFPAGVSLVAGRYGGTIQTALTGATQTMFQAARDDDFMPVVVSNSLNSALGIENIRCDDIVDIVRRRRWKHTLARVTVPA